MQEDILLLQVHGLCWNNKAVHLSVISVEVRVQAKIINEPHEVSRVEHKQDRPEDRIGELHSLTRQGLIEMLYNE